MLNDARAICSLVFHHTGEGGALLGLGMLYADQDKHDQAELSYRQALASYDSVNVPYNSARAPLALGTLYHTQHRYLEAEEAVNKALAISTRIAHDVGQAGVSELLSMISRSRSNHSEDIDMEIKTDVTLAIIGNGPARHPTRAG